MEIPDYVREQIRELVARAQQASKKGGRDPLQDTLSTTRGQTDFLRSKYMKGLGDSLDPELEAHFEQIIKLSDNPSANQYLKQIQDALEQLQKGRNFDDNA